MIASTSWRGRSDGLPENNLPFTPVGMQLSDMTFKVLRHLFCVKGAYVFELGLRLVAIASLIHKNMPNDKVHS